MFASEHSHHGTLPSGHSHHDTSIRGHLHHDIPTKGHSHHGIPTKGHLHHDIPTKGHSHHGIPIRGHLYHEIFCISTSATKYLHRDLNMYTGIITDKLCIFIPAWDICIMTIAFASLSKSICIRDKNLDLYHISFAFIEN